MPTTSISYHCLYYDNYRASLIGRLRLVRIWWCVDTYFLTSQGPHHNRSTVSNLLVFIQIYRDRRRSHYLNSQSTAHPYVRMMALASVDVIGTIPFLIWGSVVQARYMQPWVSWTDTKTSKSPPLRKSPRMRLTLFQSPLQALK